MKKSKSIVFEQTTPVRGAYDRSSAAEYLSISQSMLDKLVSEGAIRRTFAGTKPLFRRVDLDAFLEKELTVDSAR